MKKLRWFCLWGSLLVIGALSIEAFGSNQTIALNCGANQPFGGVSTATAIGDVGSASAQFFNSPPGSCQPGLSGEWFVTIQTAPASSVSAFDSAPTVQYEGTAYTATYGLGGSLTVTTDFGGGGSTYFTAVFTSASSGNFPSATTDTDPDPSEDFTGQFDIVTINPAYFGGVGCPIGTIPVCGTGSIYIDGDQVGGVEASLAADIILDAPTDPPPDPTPEPSTIVLWLSGGAFCGLVVKSRRRLACR